jgi:hypothetical protein
MREAHLRACSLHSADRYTKEERKDYNKFYYQNHKEEILQRTREKRAKLREIPINTK